MRAVDALMRKGLEAGVFPGAVLQVSREGVTVFGRAYGVANLATASPVSLHTLFDLASLTKPLATTLGVMALIQDRRLSLESRLGDLLPGWEGTDKAPLDLRHLLSHRAGFPACRRFTAIWISWFCKRWWSRCPAAVWTPGCKGPSMSPWGWTTCCL